MAGIFKTMYCTSFRNIYQITPFGYIFPGLRFKFDLAINDIKRFVE
ncbi:hypothetical protein Niako_4864 [Niastella koreensis GR20-10]|uniref:Uncharacterized protein n=1 Tax=Niastella koreensis (strain DSM 17620 / KACC 11465 / NBRC 106392 / GR20-10) TaxID=700598 RepID=G8TRH9_NIAKG|nr:hypothetical protein Niako_4864 [Niastella koreensis GR20-10]